MRVSDLSYLWVLQQQPVQGQEHQSSGVKCSTTFMGRADKHNYYEVKSCNTMTIRGRIEPNHS